MISRDKLKQVRKVIAHGGRCADGRASAMIINKAYQHVNMQIPIEFVMHNTKEHHDLVPEPGLLFVDFSVPPEKADAFFEAGTLILDHHRGPKGENKKIVQRFEEAGLGVFADEDDDPGVSGALLAYNHVWEPLTGLPDLYMRGFAELAGVRDTWQKKDPRWKTAFEQHEAIQFWPEEHLLKADVPKWPQLLKLGEILVSRKEATILKVSENLYHWTSKAGTRVCTFQGTKLSSDMAELLDNKVDLVMAFDFRQEGDKISVIYSTRSHTHFDCSKLCGHYGGGGHTRAAGFEHPIGLDSPNPYKLAIDLLDSYEVHA